MDRFLCILGTERNINLYLKVCVSQLFHRNRQWLLESIRSFWSAILIRLRWTENIAFPSVKTGLWHIKNCVVHFVELSVIVWNYTGVEVVDESAKFFLVYFSYPSGHNASPMKMLKTQKLQFFTMLDNNLQSRHSDFSVLNNPQMHMRQIRVAADQSLNAIRSNALNVFKVNVS